ncbi:MAG TPA: pectate lyase, partial [Holophaga sp.]|nr:pectate lyase [Holophaga sp.]
LPGGCRAAVRRVMRLRFPGPLVACLAASAAVAGWSAPAASWRPPAADFLADGVHHARMIYPDEQPPYPCLAQNQGGQVARNLLLWQNPDGGWPKNKDWYRILGPDERRTLVAGRGQTQNRSTLDNGSTWGQLVYLVQVRRHEGSRSYDEAIRRGLAYLLEAQNASGGWAGSDVDAVTFNDRVMVGALRALRSVAAEGPRSGSKDAGLRARARAAFDKGLACLLACQVMVDGRLTGWAQQHAHDTRLPVWGRSYEPPVLACRETAEVIAFLLELERPSADTTRAIRAALAWLDSVKLVGWRLEAREAPPIRYQYSFSRTDLVLVEDPTAPPLWARFYDPGSRKPLFYSREGVLLGRYEDLTRERRTGYEWFGNWPAALLDRPKP